MKVGVETDVLMDGRAPGLRSTETGDAAGRALPLGHPGLTCPDWAHWPPDLLAQIFVLLQTLTLRQRQVGPNSHVRHRKAEGCAQQNRDPQGMQGQEKGQLGS